MSTNQALVGDGFQILRSVLVPYLHSELHGALGKKWWEQGVLAKLDSDFKKDLPTFAEKPQDLAAKLEIYGCLLVLTLNWRDVFGKKLSKDHLTWANELKSTRNKWAHMGQNDFSAEDTFRALDTMSRFCQQLDSDKTEEIMALRRTFSYGSPAGSGEAASKSAEPAPKAAEGQAESKSLKNSPGGLLGWREIIRPHPDVAEGRYYNAEFAADLNQVAKGGGQLEYRDPEEFFSRTYLTEGLKGLLKQGLKRLGGLDGDPVIQLKTAFGGGKTHSMLALYHLMKGHSSLEKMESVREILEEAGLQTLPKAHVAVLVGTALDPSKVKTPENLPGISVNTIWGEIGYQLAVSTGRPELYKIIEPADQKKVNPGTESLQELFDQAGSCLILLDELVTYGRRIYGISNLAAGTFDNFITFIQSLTEAAKLSRNSLVVATLPESDIELGG
ncbi:MAG: DUF499 domain-containing protein, partial [Deltaproteobacteria bacterium]|nr:DUF499 domain-containing protein [Deltaproteobacteria bacterium]